MTGSRENASGVLESPGFFCNQESGNPVCITAKAADCLGCHQSCTVCAKQLLVWREKNCQVDVYFI